MILNSDLKSPSVESFCRILMRIALSSWKRVGRYQSQVYGLAVTAYFLLLMKTGYVSHAVTDSDRWVASVYWVPAVSRPDAPSMSLPSDWLPTLSRSPGRMMFPVAQSWPMMKSSAETHSLEILQENNKPCHLEVNVKTLESVTKY